MIFLGSPHITWSCDVRPTSDTIDRLVDARLRFSFQIGRAAICSHLLRGCQAHCCKTFPKLPPYLDMATPYQLPICFCWLGNHLSSNRKTSYRLFVLCRLAMPFLIQEGCVLPINLRKDRRRTVSFTTHNSRT
jgi:hypothetical protein